MIGALFLPLALALLVWALLNLQGYWAVQDAVRSLPISDLDKEAACKCFEQAAAADRRTLLYDLTAPIVMAVAVPMTKRDANQLPRAFRRWDNNISLNGDGHGWQDASGAWHNGRDGVEPPPGTPLVSYDDPAYGGDAYYAKGHHPRSKWARYVWVGLRNRASQLSVDYGRDVGQRPQLISGDLGIDRQSKPGHFLLRDGETYHFKSIHRIALGPLGALALIRSYGYKLELTKMRPDGELGRVATVAIGWSIKRWQ